MFARILVCLDGSELAEQVLPYAVEQASRFQSQVTLFQMVSSRMSFVPDSGLGPTAIPEDPQLLKEAIQQERDAAEKHLEDVAQRYFSSTSVNVKSVVVEGTNAGAAIVDFAKENDTGLIMLTTHGRSGLGRVIFGSVADHVLRESHLPVLMIRPAAS